jgi:hypothetical protein
MTIEGTLMAWSMLGFSLGSPGVSIGLGRMIAHRQAAPTRTAGAENNSQY